MRICFVALHSYPLFVPGSASGIGGTEVQISNLARYLIRRGGLAVDIVVGDFGQPPEESVDRVRLLRAISANPQARFAERIHNVLKLWRALARSAADVYVASPAGPELGIIATYCRFAGKKLVYRTAHQIDCDGSYVRDNGWRGRLFGAGLTAADAIVTQTEEHRRMLAAQGLQSIVIRNAFAVAERPSGGEKAVDALWVGRCETWKRPEVFLDLVEALPHRSFRMICPASESNAALFQAVADRAGGLANLEFIERVPFLAVQRHFDDAKLFIGTSDYEGFPNTYLQACLAGTPIGSFRVDPDGFIREEAAGFWADGEFSKLVEWVEHTLNDSDVWKGYSQRAFGYVSSRHNIAIEGERWARIFERLDRRSSDNPAVVSGARERV